MAKKYVALLVLSLLWSISKLTIENCLSITIVAGFCHIFRENAFLVKVSNILDKVGSKFDKSCLGFKNNATVEDEKKYEDSNGDNL